MTHSTACLDWAERLIARKSIIPPPIYASEAEYALAIFKRLQVVDLGRSVRDEVTGEMRAPTFGECSEEWVFDFVRAVFGAYDQATGQQKIREFAVLISKKNTKSTIAAGVMLTAVIICWRDNEDHLILAPTKEVADNSFKPAAAMVRADEELAAMFHVQPHTRTITKRTNGANLHVIAADTNTVAGTKSGRVLIDELWVFGSVEGADAMLMEATGGLVSRPEGFVIYLTTQSDKPPAGVFKQKLDYWRKVRDGLIEDPETLPILYEFPEAMIKSGAHLKPENAYITNPNLGKSVSESFIRKGLLENKAKKDGSFQKWLAKHLNIQIGGTLRADRWAGAEFWDRCAAPPLSLSDLSARSEVVVAGIDGGGLDDLLGLCVLGRERETGKWLHWAHAWAHPIALERNESIAPQLRDMAEAGELTLVERPGADVEAVVGIISGLRDAHLMPDKNAIGVDRAGIDAIHEALRGAGFTEEQIVAIPQGWKLNGAILTVERKLAGGELVHGGQSLMAWSVSNAITTMAGSAVTITKAASGRGKIDPLMATFDAASLLSLNPAAPQQKIVMLTLGN